MQIKKIAQTPGLVATVVDNLTNSSTIDALSANQGRVLNEKITNLTTYSTEEAKTGEIWIDGKPIYKKTIQFTTTATGKHIINHNISNIENVIKVEGFSKHKGAFYILPMSSASDNVKTYSISIQDVGLNDFDFFVGTALTGTVVTYLTIYYTKTTD